MHHLLLLQIMQNAWKSECIEPRFLVVKAVLDHQNYATWLFCSSTTFLTPPLTFFKTFKNWPQIMIGTSWFSSKNKRSRFTPWKQRLLLCYNIDQKDCINPMQLLKLFMWDLDIQNLNILALDVILHLSKLLNKFVHNTFNNLHHWKRLKK